MSEQGQFPKEKLREVTRSSPCPVCEGGHKCSVGEDGFLICGRRSGPQPGFVHLGHHQTDTQWHYYRREGDPALERDTPPPPRKANPAPSRATDWAERMRRSLARRTSDTDRRLAD